MAGAPEEEVWDSGLQSERTRLAWVRSAVALATGGLGAAGVALRHALPAPAVVVFTLAALCGGVLLTRTRARFRRTQAALHGGRPLDNGVDALLAWLGTLCVVAGAVAFVWSRGF
ncbi:DUF202 domain-containing protein [Nonomuraea sp. NPDC050783]|uniref:DUF202 domain-containing protein n=1 Tax=Nonomuraea sp. NPDC050783 TaxID=3154634 RepID=UPI0034669182